MNSKEEKYLRTLTELQRRNWPAGMPTEPKYPHGEIPISEYLRMWARVQPAKAALVFYGKTRTSVRTVMATSWRDTLPDELTIPAPSSILAEKILPPGTIDLMPALVNCSADLPQVTPDLDAVAALNYTGGTTSMPKGCVPTQRDMLYTAATTCTIANDIEPDEIVLNFMSLFWIAGENAGLLFPIFSGTTVILHSGWHACGATRDAYAMRLAPLPPYIRPACPLPRSSFAGALAWVAPA